MWEVSTLLVVNTLIYCGHAQGVTLTIDPNWSTFFTGESVTFICDINEGKHTDWGYTINKDGRTFVSSNPHPRYTLEPLHLGLNGKYQCCGLQRSSNDTKCSDAVSLSVTADKPKASLTAGTTTTPVGGSVTLSCSVESSAGGWKYEWFRRTSDVEVRINNEQNSVIRVSKGGVYRCTGLRGEPAFYTDISDERPVFITLSNQVIVARQPNRPQIFTDEMITLTCEVQGGETTEWTCEWKRAQIIIQLTNNKYWIFYASESSSGDYMCQCKLRDDWYSSTKWSEAISLSVSPFRAECWSFMTPFVIGLVCGVLLIAVLLLLLRCCRTINDRFSNSLNQSVIINQSSAAPQTANQGEFYSSLLHGDVSVYETIRGCGTTRSDGQANEYTNVTSHL